MTDSQLTIIVASIPPTIAALSALFVGIRNGSKAAQNKIEADQAVQAVTQKTDDIHSMVDGNLSKTQEKLDQSIEHNQLLERYIKQILDRISPGSLPPTDKVP